MAATKTISSVLLCLLLLTRIISPGEEAEAGAGELGEDRSSDRHQAGEEDDDPKSHITIVFG